MKQCKILFVFSLLNLTSFLTSALPFQHLVTFDPNDESLAPKEILVTAGLQLVTRADGNGDYVLKEVPLISRKRSKEMIFAEDTDVNEDKAKDIRITNGDEENDLAKNIEAEESSDRALNAVPNRLNVKDRNASGHIYITIPIYVNAMPGLPVMLSVGSQQIPLKASGQGIAARRQALEEEESPTSLYNKLL
ncbi:uncharacterized protein [Eurosta solidaginis]|uniref:uncharacterized protein n=1 Tax=Eurosta solidaginis TaxID=178769 RepID=UPI003530A5E1